MLIIDKYNNSTLPYKHNNDKAFKSTMSNFSKKDNALAKTRNLNFNQVSDYDICTTYMNSKMSKTQGQWVKPFGSPSLKKREIERAKLQAQ